MKSAKPARNKGTEAGTTLSEGEPKKTEKKLVGASRRRIQDNQEVASEMLTITLRIKGPNPYDLTTFLNNNRSRDNVVTIDAAHVQEFGNLLHDMVKQVSLPQRVSPPPPKMIEITFQTGL